MEQLEYRIGLNTFKCEIQLVSVASFIHFGPLESKVCTDKMGCSANFLYVMIEHDTKYACVSLLPFTNLIKFCLYSSTLPCYYSTETTFQYSHALTFYQSIRYMLCSASRHLELCFPRVPGRKPQFNVTLLLSSSIIYSECCKSVQFCSSVLASHLGTYIHICY